MTNIKPKDAFSHLGLDPEHLRGVPDEIVARIVKFAFRTLIMLYHDDKRTFDNEFEEEKHKKKFDRRREEITTAYSLVSTPTGRLEAMASETRSTIGKIKKELSETQTAMGQIMAINNRTKLEYILDGAGILTPPSDPNRKRRAMPINMLSHGGRILIANYAFNSPRYISIRLDNNGWIDEFRECFMVEASKFRRPKDQIWSIEETKTQPKRFARPGKVLPYTKRFKIAGTIRSDDAFKSITRNVAGLITNGSFLPNTPISDRVDVPFFRVHHSRMEMYVEHLVPLILLQLQLVLIDTDGAFHFPGLAIRFRLPEPTPKRVQKNKHI